MTSKKETISSLNIDNDSGYKNYLEEMNKYYSLKKKYVNTKETFKNKLINSKNSIEAKKKLLTKQKFKCVNCNKEGGTIFQETNEFLKATCGNISDPCDLNIMITKMNSLNVYDEYVKFNDLLKDTKSNITITKLDFLFKYLEEDIAVEKFESLKSELSTYQEKYNQLLMYYESIVNNEERENAINEKLVEHYNLVNSYKEFIQLFKTSGEKKYLTDAIQLYISKIMDLNKSILELKYKTNSVEVKDEENILIQRKYNISDMEIINKP